MARRELSNPLALAILACLSERPMYPYEITSTLRHRGKEGSIRLNYGSLYAVIKTLEKNGLIVARHAEREGNRPERIVYEITEDGRQKSIGWLSGLLARPAKEYPDFEAALSLLPLLPPETVLTLLDERLARLDDELASIAETSARPDVARLPELFTVEWNYHEAMVRAERAFVARLGARLRDRELGGYDTWERLHRLAAEGHSFEETLSNPAAYFDKEVAALIDSGHADENA